MVLVAFSSVTVLQAVLVTVGEDNVIIVVGDGCCEVHMGICMSSGDDGGSCNGSKSGSIESGGGALERRE